MCMHAHIHIGKHTYIYHTYVHKYVCMYVHTYLHVIHTYVHIMHTYNIYMCMMLICIICRFPMS